MNHIWLNEQSRYFQHVSAQITDFVEAALCLDVSDWFTKAKNAVLIEIPSFHLLSPLAPGARGSLALKLSTLTKSKVRLFRQGYTKILNRVMPASQTAIFVLTERMMTTANRI